MDMASEIKSWQIVGGKLVPIQSSLWEMVNHLKVRLVGELWMIGDWNCCGDYSRL